MKIFILLFIVFAVLIFIEPIYLSISSVGAEKFAVKVILGSKQSPWTSKPYGIFPKKNVFDWQ